jgi:hypothetical protein
MTDYKMQIPADHSEASQLDMYKEGISRYQRENFKIIFFIFCGLVKCYICYFEPDTESTFFILKKVMTIICLFSTVSV